MTIKSLIFCYYLFGC